MSTNNGHESFSKEFNMPTYCLNPNALANA